jgi:hypothetical protein
MNCTGSVVVVVVPMQHQNKSHRRTLVGIVSCLVGVHYIQSKKIREALLLNYYLPWM